MNKSLQNGKFITEWKNAKVIPLDKSGPNIDIERNNCRPISILPILTKVLEKENHSCYGDYLTEFKLFTIAQSGLKKLHPTVTSLMHITDRWLSNIDKGLVTGVVFIGLCYLKGHTQSVSVDGQLSDPLLVTIGVTQGSLL